jgi:hypothetical protein
MHTPFDRGRDKRPPRETSRPEDIAGCLAAAVFFALAAILIAGSIQEPAAGVDGSHTASITIGADAHDAGPCSPYIVHATGAHDADCAH